MSCGVTLGLCEYSGERMFESKSEWVAPLLILFQWFLCSNFKIYWGCLLLATITCLPWSRLLSPRIWVTAVDSWLLSPLASNPESVLSAAVGNSFKNRSQIRSLLCKLLVSPLHSEQKSESSQWLKSPSPHLPGLAPHLIYTHLLYHAITAIPWTHVYVPRSW